jgi:hypothetical protein
MKIFHGAVSLRSPSGPSRLESRYPCRITPVFRRFRISSILPRLIRIRTRVIRRNFRGAHPFQRPRNARCRALMSAASGSFAGNDTAASRETASFTTPIERIMNIDWQSVRLLPRISFLIERFFNHCRLMQHLWRKIQTRVPAVSLTLSGAILLGNWLQRPSQDDGSAPVERRSESRHQSLER